MHLNERLEFGMESVSKVSHSFLKGKEGVIPCRVALVDMGLDMVDPGLAPDGAKCGKGKVSVWTGPAHAVTAAASGVGSVGRNISWFGSWSEAAAMVVQTCKSPYYTH